MKLFHVLAVSIAASAAVSYAATANNYGMTKEQVEEIVRTYIQDNPQEILDSVRNHQVAQEERSKQDQRALARDNHDLIYNAPHSPTFGDDDAVVTLVEFYDYNCPACKTMFSSIDAILKKSPGKLRVIFKEFPIFGPQSDQNAKVAFAVNAIAPEKFFDWHALMMTHKGRADVAFALASAAEVGLDQAEVAERMKDPEFEAYINTDRELAQLLNIRGTPAVVIGDLVVNSALPQKELEAIIDEFERSRDEAIKNATGGVIQNHSE